MLRSSLYVLIHLVLPCYSGKAVGLQFSCYFCEKVLYVSIIARVNRMGKGMQLAVWRPAVLHSFWLRVMREYGKLCR